MFSCQDLQMFSLNPVVQSLERARVCHREVPRPSTTEIRERVEQQPRMEPNSWLESRTVRRAEEAHRCVHTPHHARILGSANTHCGTVFAWGGVSTHLSHKSIQGVIHHNLVRPFIVKCPLFFSNPGKTPSHLWPGLTWNLPFTVRC